MSELKDVIETVLKETFDEIYYAYKEHKEDTENENIKNENTKNSKSHIVFPKYKNNEEIRVSEQELRFVFVEKLNQNICENNKYYYSVETPTDNSYVFSKEEGPKVDGGGVSARIDLTIHKKIDNKFERAALIEFKAHNPDTIDYRKDICKLINEETNNDCLKYFIQIINIDAKNEEKTWNNIKNKKIIAINDLDSRNEKKEMYSIEYRCYNLGSMHSMCGKIEDGELKI